jgi:hypothetical protein
MRNSARNGKAARKLFLWLLMVAMLLSSVSSVFADAPPAAELEAAEAGGQANPVAGEAAEAGGQVNPEAREATEAGGVEESVGLKVPSLAAANQTAALDEVVLGDFEDDSESWRFSLGPEFPGAVGGYERIETNTTLNSYAAQLSGDFNVGGQYVSMKRGIGSLDIQQLSLSVKTEDLGKLRLRLIDNTGQVHQQRLALQADGQWHAITVSTFAGGEGYEHFSGANDGIWHAPAREMAFILERSDLLNGKKQGEILIDNVIASIPMPPLMLRQKQLGNIFVEGEQPAIDIATAGDAVSWTIFDFWGNEAGSGQAEPVNGIVNLAPALTSKGYYTVKVKAYSEGTLLDTKETSLALLAPFDLQQVTNSPFGIGTHFGQSWSPELIPLLDKLGVKNIRDEIYWNTVEMTKGQYEFQAKYETFMQQLKQKGIKPFIIFSYTNPHYDQGSTPYSPEGRTGYANYGIALLEQYGDQMSWVEVYNEFNHKGPGNIGNGPANSLPEYYYELLKKTYETVKAHDPEVVVVGPASSGYAFPWMEQLFSMGGLDYMDAVSIHPYRFPMAPESGVEELTQMRELIKTYNNNVEKPIWMSEMGWPTLKDSSGIDEKIQAAFIVRSIALALANGVEKYFWYNFMNDGVDPLNKEHNFGIIRNPADQLGKNTPKPAYVSYAAMTRALSHAAFKEKETISDSIYSIVFEEEAQDIRVLWSEDPQQVTIHTSSPITVTDMMGESQSYDPGPTQTVYLHLTDAPVYLKGSVDSIQAGSGFELIDTEAAVGDPIVLTLEIDHQKAAAGNESIDAEFQIEGLKFPFKIGGNAAQKVNITLPGQQTLGKKLVTGDVLVQGKRIARLSAEVTIIEPLSLQARHIWKKDRDQLQLVITNSSATERRISKLDWIIGDQSGTEVLERSIAARSKLNMELPLVGLQAGQTHNMKLALYSEQGSPLDVEGKIVIKEESDYNNFAYQTIRIDGELDKWEKATAIDWGKDGEVKLEPYLGEDDLSGQLWATWDKQYLYLSARVVDDVFSQTNSGDQIWQGDSIQFALAPGLPGEYDKWYEIGLALTPHGPQVYQWMDIGSNTGRPITSAKLAVKRNDQTNETVYELALPWSVIDTTSPDDRIFSFSFLVNDNDGQGRKGYIEWGSGIGTVKGPQYFNAVRLIGEAPSEGDGGTGGWTPSPGTGTEGNNGGAEPKQPEEGAGEEAESGEGKEPFTDTAGHWAYSSIKQAIDRGLINGYPDGSFRPDRQVTRAEFIHMLAKFMGWLKEAEAFKADDRRPTFTDEAQIGAWAKLSIDQAAAAGVIKGNPDGSLRPNAAISRAEMALIIARALNLNVEAYDKTGFADDAAIPGWVKSEVEALRQLGLLQGKGNNKFAPQATATRAEAVTVVMRMMELPD